MVLNKISKGAKEIDIAATLEYLRDQRPGMIKNKVNIIDIFAYQSIKITNLLLEIQKGSIWVFICGNHGRTSQYVKSIATINHN